MTKLDFNKNFVPLKGQTEEGVGKMNETLSFVISKSEDTKNPVKLYGWAVKLSTNGILELDKADVELLKKFIIESKMLFVAAKGQLIEHIDSVKEQ